MVYSRDARAIRQKTSENSWNQNQVWLHENSQCNFTTLNSTLDFRHHQTHSESPWHRNWNPQKSFDWLYLSSQLEWSPTNARKLRCNLDTLRDLYLSLSSYKISTVDFFRYISIHVWFSFAVYSIMMYYGRFLKWGLPPPDWPLRTIQLLGYTTHFWKPPDGFQTSLASRRCRSCKVALALSGNTFLTCLSPHFDSDMK